MFPKATEKQGALLPLPLLNPTPPSEYPKYGEDMGQGDG